LRKNIRNAGKHRSACGYCGCGYELTAIHHDWASPIDFQNVKNFFVPAESPGAV
jgi:hypothetical protein